MNINGAVNRKKRDLIKLLTLATVCGPLVGRAAMLAPLSASPFKLGVASGSPASDGFVLWTRLIDAGLTQASVAVHWEVFDNAKGGAVVASGEAAALAELAYSVHVEVAGLAPDRQYGYRFKAGGFETAPAQARTLPDPQQASVKLRLAYASCQRWEDGQYAAYRHMLAENVDFVVFVGDYIYESKSRSAAEAVRVHPYPHVRNLEDYRQRYAMYKSDPALQAMHAACPWLVTWDDHEVENNYAGEVSTRGTAKFEQRRIAAYQAFYEHMPLRAATMIKGVRGLRQGAELRIYQYYDFGRLARLYLLDDRQYRAAPPCGESPKVGLAAVCVPAAPNDARSMLGEVQEAWLSKAMGDSAGRKTRWNLIVQQTRFTPANYRYGRGVKASDDHWDAYPTARQRLLNAIRDQRPANPVILGGDVHLNWVANVHLDPYDVRSPLIASEFCGTSISSRNEGSQKKAEKHQHDNPHCLLVNKEKRGYGVLELSAEQANVRLRVVDDVARLDSGIATLASFSVANGRAGPKRTS